MMNPLDIVTVVAASSAAGKKIFLPGFLFSVFVQLGLVRLPGEIAFLSSVWALVILGLLAGAEIAADFIPGVGSTMQSVKLFVAPVASALLAFCMLYDADPGLRIAVMLVSAACGEAVQVASSGLSMASVQATGGGGDPLVNLEEVFSSSAMVTLAVFLPAVALALFVILLAAGIVGFVLYRRSKRKKAAQRLAYGESLLAERDRLILEINALNAGQPEPPLPPEEGVAQLERLNRKLSVNRQAIFEFEAQSHFPVPEQYRKPGHLYVRSKRRMLVVALLSVLPGLGHIYVGQWQKGLLFLAAAVGIDFFLTPFLMALLGVFFPLALIVPLVYRCILFTDLEMIRQKLNASVPVRPFEFF